MPYRTSGHIDVGIETMDCMAVFPTSQDFFPEDSIPSKVSKLDTSRPFKCFFRATDHRNVV